MPVEQGKSFSEIFNSLTHQEGEMPCKRVSGNLAHFPNPEDSIQLSVRAKNSVRGKVVSVAPKREAKEEPASQRVDDQGNRVKISGHGNALAGGEAGHVAWETPKVHPSEAAARTEAKSNNAAVEWEDDRPAITG